MADQAFWYGRRVLVTGCTGLIGTAVVRELLAAKANVVGLVRDRIPDGDYQRDPRFRAVHVLRGRVEDRFRIQSALAIHNIQSVFHLVGPTDGSNPDRGTASVLSAIQGHDSHIPIVTARPMPGLGIAGETAGLMKCPVPWGVAEFGEVFGAGDRCTFRVVPGTIVGHVLGDPSLAPIEPGPAKDFVHAADAARACLALGESLANGGAGQSVVPFRSGWIYTDSDMAAIVRAVAANSPLPPASDTLVERPLGWAPAATLADGLRETISWYRDFLRSRFFGTRSAMQSQRAAA